MKTFAFAILMVAGTVLVFPQTTMAANIQGTPGNDVLTGTATADTIRGNGGNDQTSGLGGNDRVVSNGICSDGLIGGSGNDVISGGDGDDCIAGFNGLNSLKGDKDNDLIAGGQAVDVIVSEWIASGNDNITSGNFGPLQVRDGVADAVLCDAGLDVVYVGPNEGDLVDSSCERILVQP